MNAEVAEIGLGGLWVQQNAVVEQITKRYSAETESMSRVIRETNKARQAMQVKAFPELKKLNHKRETALQRKFMCQQAYHRVKGIMLGERGCALSWNTCHVQSTHLSIPHAVVLQYLVFRLYFVLNIIRSPPNVTR